MATRIVVLGSPRLVVDEQPAELPAKAVALLAYLALAEAPVPRERVVGLLWGESSEDVARKNLRNSLWVIRRLLGDDAVRKYADRLVLDAGLWVDVREFERHVRGGPPTLVPENAAQRSRTKQLHAALATYGGPLLEGVVLGEAPEFEIWLITARERLHQVYTRTLYESVELARAQGQWDTVIAAAQRALTDDPLLEPIHQMLIEALARRGKRAEALHQYTTLRALLGRELGVAPLPETEALRTAIAGGTLLPKAEHAAVAAFRPQRHARQPMLGEHAPTPFVGRDAELVALDSALAATLNNTPRVVLLAGEIGIGKSRLWREWASYLAPTLTVLEARCVSATQSLPFVPLIELFSKPLCTQVLFGADSPIAPLWLTEVARLLPEVRVALPHLPLPTTLPPDEERRRVCEAFVECVRALNSHGLVLFIDDLHWIDQATLDWLAYLRVRLPDQPVLLAASYRAEEASPALLGQIALWRREGHLEYLNLQRLSDAETETLIRSLPGGGERVAQVREQSGGNPYFAIELVQAKPDEMPLALADMVQMRLNRLPQQVHQVVQAAAVLEPDIDVASLRQTSGRSEEETLDALDTLLQAALLSEGTGTYAFAHPLIATVATTTISRARYAFLHRRAAQAREAQATGRLAPSAGRIAHHYEQAGDLPQAAHFAELAADHALSLAAPTEAVALGRRAVAFEPTATRHLKLGRALERAGDLQAARAALEEALVAFASDGDTPMACRTCLDIALTFLSSGAGALVITWAERAKTMVSDATDAYANAYIHFLLGAGLQQLGQDGIGAEHHLRTAAQIAAASNLPQLTARSQFQLGNLLAEHGELKAATAAFRQTVRLAHTVGDVFQEVLGDNNLAYHLLLLGDVEGARHVLEEGFALAERVALRVPLQWLYSTRGELSLAEKKWAEAETWFERGRAEAEQQHNQTQLANYRAHLGRVALGRGHFERGLAQLKQAHAEATKLSARHLQRQIDHWLAEADRAQADSGP